MHMDLEFLSNTERLRKELRSAHQETARACTDAVQPLTYVDVFFAGALRRSYSLTRGFFQLFLARNFTCAAPLVRFQLDNVLRVTACVYAEPDACGFVEGLLAGRRPDQMKDRLGHRMTDSYLCTLLANSYAWIPAVYRESSGFVHLSEKHLLQAVIAGGPTAEHFKYTLAEMEVDVPKNAWEEILTTFGELSSLLLLLVRSWPDTKTKHGGP